MRAPLLLFAALLFAPAFPQFDARLDSIAWDRMASWMKPNGRNKRHNFQFHFRYGEHYRFDGALGQVSKRDTTNPAGPRYKTASVAKTFVAVLVLQLVEEGRVALDSAVVRYLPEELVRPLVRVKGKDLGHTITVRQLLAHMSGLSDYIFDDWRFLARTQLNPSKARTPQEHLRIAVKHGMAKRKTSLPGSAFHYSDTGYLLLALLVEEVGATSLNTQLQERICSPLGLHDTWTDSWDSAYTRMMHQYHGRRDVTAVLHPSVEFGGGGLISSTADLARFINGLAKGELLRDRSTLDLMLKRHSPAYGLGIDVIRFDAKPSGIAGLDSLTMIGHSGFFGVNMYHIPELDVTWVSSIGQVKGFEKERRALPWWPLLKECIRLYGVRPRE
ncbi:MAG: beta-lactamase family protein [Flavobacteriales bacterium]|nr:beta-lactamase family protein [Flavobacteriales bacterium]